MGLLGEAWFLPLPFCKIYSPDVTLKWTTCRHVHTSYQQEANSACPSVSPKIHIHHGKQHSNQSMPSLKSASREAGYVRLSSLTKALLWSSQQIPSANSNPEHLQKVVTDSYEPIQRFDTCPKPVICNNIQCNCNTRLLADLQGVFELNAK